MCSKLCSIFNLCPRRMSTAPPRTDNALSHPYRELFSMALRRNRAPHLIGYADPVCDPLHHEEHVSSGSRPDLADRVLFPGLRCSDEVIDQSMRSMIASVSARKVSPSISTKSWGISMTCPFWASVRLASTVARCWTESRGRRAATPSVPQGAGTARGGSRPACRDYGLFGGAFTSPAGLPSGHRMPPPYRRGFRRPRPGWLAAGQAASASSRSDPAGGRGG